MKILYISHSTGIDQGALIALRHIVLSMRALGHEPIVVFPGEGGMKTILETEGISCYSMIFRMARYPRFSTWRALPADIFHFLAIPFRNIIAEWKLMRLIRTHHIDLVHINSSVVAVGQRAARLTGVPYIVHVREMISPQALPWHMFPSNQHFRRRLQACNNCIAITHSVRDFWGLTERTTQVIYDGVFSLEKKPDIQLQKKPYFLCIGVINTTKAQLDVLLAFAMIAVHNHSYELWLVGEANPKNPYFINLKHQIEELHLNDRVHILGVRHDIYDLMRNASATIAASEREGFGFTTVESMLCGCIVIGRDAAGIREQFDRGKELTGKEIGLRFNTIEQLAEQMEAICKNSPTHYQQMLTRAQDLVFNEYSVSNSAKKIEALYFQILQSK